MSVLNICVSLFDILLPHVKLYHTLRSKLVEINYIGRFLIADQINHEQRGVGKTGDRMRKAAFLALPLAWGDGTTCMLAGDGMPRGYAAAFSTVLPKVHAGFSSLAEVPFDRVRLSGGIHEWIVELLQDIDG